ncbi:L-rhamnose mutarotase [Paenibacillus sacheonensis]|uniref:L-rhamnose mutarotase n=1 Tax=Paenibacillus sacheonensis TaxID=742054 RepID=A0A7X4YTY5_9BACL|nr:L-rhamnose mutarotase [Paenibacillus sacheonensis]MBM7568834.1 L-rhamnose mutarotase [Paenibacillus sacheonensis]NBC72537.1 L-rhamnose mutarotase [Paenibacillus sacheonensis]
MEHISFALRIDPANIEEYIRRHDNIDPELEAAFARYGIKQYHIFHMGDGTLFAHMQVENHEEAMRGIAATPANETWQRHMADLLLPWENGQLSKPLRAAYAFEAGE